MKKRINDEQKFLIIIIIIKENTFREKVSIKLFLTELAAVFHRVFRLFLFQYFNVFVWNYENKQIFRLVSHVFF